MFNPWVGKISWRRAWQPTPVCLPGHIRRDWACTHDKKYTLFTLFQIIWHICQWTLINGTCLALFSSSGRVTVFYQASNWWRWQGSGKNAIIEEFYPMAGLPGGSVVKNPPARHEPQGTWVWSLSAKILWRRAWQPTPVFSPGASHGQRSLAGYHPQGRKESDMTEAT